jgi:hypothetical protein
MRQLMTTEELNHVISKLKNNDFESEKELRSLLPEFVEALGYNSDNLFFEVSIDKDDIPEPSEPVPTPVVDAVIKSNSRSPPWMVISVELMDASLPFPGHRGEMARIEEERLRVVYENTPAKHIVSFSNKLITYISEGTFSGRKIEHWSESDDLYESLKAPESLPHQESLLNEEEEWGNVIEGPHFKLDLNEYRTILDRVENAESSHEKGKSLKKLATLLFNNIDYFSVRHQNIRTTSSELDVVVENTGTDRSPFDSYDRFILVEAKNWNKPVGASHVRDFIEKIRSVQVDIGVIIAPEGVTGESGEDAVDQLNQVYQRSGIIVVVIDDSDFKDILNGEGFPEILEDKIFNRRFRRVT